jgi:hypothetical protein
VPDDGVRAGVESGGDQLLADLDDQRDHLGGNRGRVGLGSSGARLEDRLALDPVAGQQLIQPRPGDAVLGGDVADRTVLDHHSGDQQTVQRHARTLDGGLGSVRDLPRHSPACLETPVRDVLSEDTVTRSHRHLRLLTRTRLWTDLPP